MGSYWRASRRGSVLLDRNGGVCDDVSNEDDADDKANLRVVTDKDQVVHPHYHRRDRRRHTVMIGSIVSSQLLLLLATPSSSICIPDFLESAIQLSCTYARQLQLKPFLLGVNRCRPTRDYHNCAPPWLHL